LATTSVTPITRLSDLGVPICSELGPILTGKLSALSFARIVSIPAAFKKWPEYQRGDRASLKLASRCGISALGARPAAATDGFINALDLGDVL
jgi:hypothetical protein